MTVSSSSTTCPLCLGGHTDSIERLSGSELNAAWQRSFGIDARIGAQQIDYRHCLDCGLKFFTPPEDGPPTLYEVLQRQDWYYLTDKPEYQIAKRHLPTSGEVLEVGAGKAAFAAIAGRERYLGLEFNDAAIKRAAGEGITLLKQSIQSHAEHRPANYAAVVSFQVLEHVADAAGFVTACVKALSPGGRLILAVPDNDGLCGKAQNNVLDMPPHHVSHWNERALRHIAQVHGLTLAGIEREPVSELHLPWARHTVVEARLRRLLGLPARLLDRSLAGGIARRVAGFASRKWPVDVQTLSGHTILGIYQKP